MVSMQGGGAGGSAGAMIALLKKYGLAGAAGGAISGAAAGKTGAGSDWSYPGGGSSMDYLAASQAAYEPQFDYLDSLSKGSINRAELSGDQLKKLYASLQAEIAGQEGGIRKNYDQSIGDVNAAYGGALGNVKAGFDSSRNGVAETLARLGIEEAGANTVGKQSAMQALMQGILGANSQASTNALREGKASSIAFNTQQKNAAGLAGTEAQTGLRNKLQDFLQQLDAQRATLNSQVNNQALTMRSQADQNAYNQWKDERDFNYKVGKDKADYDLAQAKLVGGTSSPKLDPMGEVNKLALTLYGNSQGAGNAVKAVTDALTQMGQEGQDVNFASLMATINQRLGHLRNGQGPGDQGNLRQLAALLYDKMYG